MCLHADSIEVANSYVDNEGDIAEDCFTLPDKSMAEKDLLAVHGQKRARKEPSQFDPSSTVKRKRITRYIFILYSRHY